MKKYRVLITDGLDPVGIDLLKTHPEIEFDYHESISKPELLKKIGDYPILITKNVGIDSDIFQAGTRLRLIVHTGENAHESIDIEAAKKKGVAILSSGAASSLSVAEHTLSLLLSLTRQTHENAAALKAGKWLKGNRATTELHGKVLGVLGLGNVGKIVSEKAMAFGMQVIAFDPLYPSVALLPNKFKMLETRFTLARNSDEVLHHADFLSIHINQKSDAAPVIGEKELASMKDGVFLLCFSHPAALDTNAVVKSLSSGKCAGVALDVPSEADAKKLGAFLSNDRVLATAALAAETKDARERTAAQAAEQVLIFVNTGLKRETLN